MPDTRELANAGDPLTLAQPPRFLFRTPPMPCPYLAGRVERHVFAEVAGPGSADAYDALSRAGFRRSHRVAYRPACPGCGACVPVRVAVERFRPSRSQRRVAKANLDLAVRELPPVATGEQYRLFARYQRSRHGDGEMARMGFEEYRAMVEDSAVGTALAEFRSADDTLRAACLFDRLADGLSAVYSFFDPDESARGLGTSAVLWLIDQARSESRPYVYLGYWIKDSRKMAYKARFRPIQALVSGAWRDMAEADIR
ncbi:MAG: arginyltransferase [Alphaproteobacteria bacterium]|nr:arginyltransferase [Alphaproteobacteria bacterium]